MDDLELEAGAFESFEASPGTLGLNLDRVTDHVRLRMEAGADALVIEAEGDTDAVTLDLGEDFPLILSYELADGDGTITRMLAPRIET